jgi:hypothetical protein
MTKDSGLIRMETVKAVAISFSRGAPACPHADDASWQEAADRISQYLRHWLWPLNGTRDKPEGHNTCGRLKRRDNPPAGIRVADQSDRIGASTGTAQSPEGYSPRGAADRLTGMKAEQPNRLEAALENLQLSHLA